MGSPMLVISICMGKSIRIQWVKNSVDHDQLASIFLKAEFLKWNLPLGFTQFVNDSPEFTHQ